MPRLLMPYGSEFREAWSKYHSYYATFSIGGISMKGATHMAVELMKALGYRAVPLDGRRYTWEVDDA